MLYPSEVTIFYLYPYIGAISEFNIRMLVEKVPSPALSGTWFGTANATNKQHVNVAVAIYIRHRDRVR